MLSSSKLEALADDDLDLRIAAERSKLLVAIDLCLSVTHRKGRETTLMALECAVEVVGTCAAIVTNPKAYFENLNRRM